MKIYISANIEAVCGVTNWDETTKGTYPGAALQSAKRVPFRTTDYFDVLRFLLFTL
jgi:D-aminopeptidase